MKKILMFILFLLLNSSVCFGAAATMYVTVAGAGAKDGAAWASAMGYAEWETDLEASAEAGDIYYVQGGTYTLTSDFVTALDGSSTAPIRIIGVKAATTHEGAAIVATDFPTVAEIRAGTDGPILTDGAGTFSVDIDDYWIIKNVRVLSSDTNGLSIGANSKAENCYATTDGTGTKYAINGTGLTSEIINCEATAPNASTGAAITGGTALRVISNYIHDSAIGVSALTSDNFVITGNFIDTCPIGISAGNASISHIIMNNTIYNDDKADAGSIGISAGTTDTGYIILNNIITGFESGIICADNAARTWVVDYNDIYDCTTDRTTAADMLDASVKQGIYDIDVNPAFTNAATGDFSVTAAGVLGDGFMGTDGN